MHKLKKAQSTCPVVNHAQDLHQSVIGVQLMFLARENKSLLFWLSMLCKNSAMKINYIYNTGGPQLVRFQLVQSPV